MACSWDGTIAYLKFSDDEIGVPFSNSEMANFYKTVYGKSIDSIGMNGLHNGMINGTDPHAVVEDPEILKLQKQQEQRQKEAAAQAAANELRFVSAKKVNITYTFFFYKQPLFQLSLRVLKKKPVFRLKRPECVLISR